MIYYSKKKKPAYTASTTAVPKQCPENIKAPVLSRDSNILSKRSRRSIEFSLEHPQQLPQASPVIVTMSTPLAGNLGIRFLTIQCAQLQQCQLQVFHQHYTMFYHCITPR